MEEVVCQDAHEQPGLVGWESLATRLIPTQCVLPLFDPVLNVPTTVVHLDHLPGKELGVGQDETYPRSLSDWELKVSIIPARCFHKTDAMGPFVSVES